ncbi:MAG: hypothetical protein COA49_04020 [Bacteroidetes bacterium]|nr:MAG: hypothetical protein COA49_04020 [Bacteroidota bacterium]
MRKNITKLIFSLFGLLIINNSIIAQLSITGELRPRFEYRHGYKSVTDSAQNPAAFVQQRTRLNFGYKADGYRVKMSLQDIHVWGSQPQLISTYSGINPNGAYLSLHEAWGEAFLNKYLSFKFGRQEIILDDSRIFGNVNWAQQARSHDAAMFIYNKGNLQFQIAGAYNQDKAALENTTASKGNYKSFQYFWIHNKFNDNFNVSLLFLNNGKEQLDSVRINNQPTDITYNDKYSQTMGTRLVYTKGKVSSNASFYYQTGILGDRTQVFTDINGDYDKHISAINFSGDVSYNITDHLTSTIGYEYLSGQSLADTSYSYRTKTHSFTPLYGTNHKFNGFMDYFYVGNHVGNVGLRDVYMKLKHKKDNYWYGLDVHAFSAANEVLDGFKIDQENQIALATIGNISGVDQLQTMPSYFGTEFDFTFGTDISKGVVLKAGYSVMLATETLAYVKGVVNYEGQGRVSQNNNWGWLMIIIKPDFLSQNE